jgi:hypothetical protein
MSTVPLQNNSVFPEAFGRVDDFIHTGIYRRQRTEVFSEK